MRKVRLGNHAALTALLVVAACAATLKVGQRAADYPQMTPMDAEPETTA